MRFRVFLELKRTENEENAKDPKSTQWWRRQDQKGDAVMSWKGGLLEENPWLPSSFASVNFDAVTEGRHKSIMSAWRRH